MNEKTRVEKLNVVLADTYAVFMLTQNIHWNIVGSNFYGVHKMTQVHYEEIADAIDIIAERIRALGHPAPSGFNVYTALTTVPSVDTTMLSNHAVCLHLIDAHQQVCQSLKKVITTADAENDSATSDLMIERLQAHEKYIWMLTATISGS